MMKRNNQSSYKNLYSGHMKTSSRSKLSASNVKLNAPQYLSNKENESRNVNRLHTEHAYDSLQPRLRKQFKLYTELEQDDKNPLKLKVQKLEQILHKRINNQGFMNFFKTANSSTNMNHIDIYIQLRSFEDALLERNKTIKNLEFKVHELNLEVENLLSLKEENGNKHLKQIKMFNEVIDKMKQASNESKQYKNKYYQMKQLCEQVQKQRISQISKIKELEQRQVTDRSEEIEVMRDELEKLNLRFQESQNKGQDLETQNSRLRLVLQQRGERMKQLQLGLSNFQQQKHKRQQIDKERSLKSKALQSIIKTNQSALLQKQCTLKTYLLKIEQSTKKIQSLQIQRDFEKCQREKTTDQILQLKLKIQKLSSTIQTNESTKNSKLTQLDTLKKQKSELQQSNIQLKLKNEDLQREQEELLKQISQMSSQLKQTVLNEKKQSTQKYRFILKLQQHISELKQFNTHCGREEEKDCDKILNDFSSIVSNVRERFSELESKHCTLELEKESRSENAAFNIEVREETISILVKFVPEYCRKLVEDYLIVTEDSLTDPGNTNIGKRMNLIEKIQKEAAVIKQTWKDLENSKQKMKQYQALKKKMQRDTQISKQKQRQSQNQRLKERQRQRQKLIQNQRQMSFSRRKLQKTDTLQNSINLQTRFREKSLNKTMIRKYFQ